LNSSLERLSQATLRWNEGREKLKCDPVKQIHLSKVEYASRAESGQIFDFYMGKNTPERKDYIMDSLVVPVEE